VAPDQGKTRLACRPVPVCRGSRQRGFIGLHSRRLLGAADLPVRQAACLPSQVLLEALHLVSQCGHLAAA
jgi:hypothetical protein